MSSSALFKMSLKLARKAIPFKLDCLCLPPTQFSNGILKECFQVHGTQRENRDLFSGRLYSYGSLMCRNCSFIQTTKQERNANISITLLEHLEDLRFIVQQFLLFSANGIQRKNKPRKASPYTCYWKQELPLNLQNREGPCRSLHIPRTWQVPLSLLQE